MGVGVCCVAAVSQGPGRGFRSDLSCRLQWAALTAKGCGAVMLPSGPRRVSKFAATLRRIGKVNKEG